MKKINLKKVNKNTLCNVLIAVNVGTLILNIINKKKKNKVATQKDINDLYDYIVDIYDDVYDKIDDKLERDRIDAFRYIDSKLDNPKPNLGTTNVTPYIYSKACTTTTGSEPVYVRDTDFK